MNRLWMMALLVACVAAGCNSSPSAPEAIPPAATINSLQPAATPQPAPSAQPKPEVASASPSTPTPTPPAETKPLLNTMCDSVCKRSDELHCDKAKDCRSICAQSMTYALCDSLLIAATQCVLQHPASDWKCIERGLAQIKEPFCDAEQRAFGKCLMAQAPKQPE